MLIIADTVIMSARRLPTDILYVSPGHAALDATQGFILQEDSVFLIDQSPVFLCP